MENTRNRVAPAPGNKCVCPPVEMVPGYPQGPCDFCIAEAEAYEPCHECGDQYRPEEDPCKSCAE